MNEEKLMLITNFIMNVWTREQQQQHNECFEILTENIIKYY